MSWFFDVAPYILALGTIALGAFEIVKDWKEYEKSRLKIGVAGVFIVVAVLSIASLYHDNQEKKEVKNKAEADMKSLKSKVDTANQAQTDNTRLFLDSFNKMSTQVSDLKSDVKTEALQKKLASVQTELLKTQKAMAPGPKAELVFTFVPYSNPAPPGVPAPTKEIAVVPNGDGSVHVEFAIVNPTKVDAEDIALDLRICKDCKYAKEPILFTKIAGMADQVRFINIPSLHALEVFQNINLDIVPVPGFDSMSVGFSYRCRTCILAIGSTPETSGIIRIKKP